MDDDSKKLVPVTLMVQQWQLDYSKTMMEQGHISETDFLQAVLNTALLRHIPEEAWPEMTDEEKAKLEEYLKRDDVDSEIPF